jgi:hypothetical protein
MDRPVREADGWALTPHVHTLNPMIAVSGCGLSADLPDIADYADVGGLTTRNPDLELRPGMTFAFEPNCMLGRRRVNIGARS